MFIPTTVSWVVDPINYWIGWPSQPKHNPTKFYYFIELGAYIHQLLWTEVKRSDALEMIIHHIATISLLVLSYLACFTRIGTVVLFLHDLSDVFLEAAKCLNYTSKAAGRKYFGPISEVVFAVFAITFFITRLVLYPRYVLHSVLWVGPTATIYSQHFAGYYIFVVFLVILQFLHIFWFYLIAKMVFVMFTSGITKDIRSDDENEDEVKKE